MSSAVDILTQPEQTIHYPESDGQPIADNTRQFRWIVMIKENLETLFRDRANVFVAGDLLWYPIEGQPRICRAPDALVVFGRPKGDRGSYRQWEEAGIGPQVVFEIYSPANTFKDMGDKLLFYDTTYAVPSLEVDIASGRAERDILFHKNLAHRAKFL